MIETIDKMNEYKLKISDNLSLPSSLLTKRIGVLARVGAGKSYTAAVIAEELLDFIIKFASIDKGKIIILDPQGIWYTLRELYPIHIIGGAHADIKLDLENARKYAQMVHDLNISVVIDLKGERKEGIQSFGGDFIDELYFLTRTPTMLILEEGDLFAPQKTGGNIEAKNSLNAVDSVVRRARGDGMGCMIISQRTQAVDKSILEQNDVYIFMQNSGSRAIKVIKEVLENVGLKPETVKKYINQMTSFKQGEALVVAPGYLDDVKKINVRRRHSEHGGDTREFGKEKKEIKLIPIESAPLLNYLNETIQESTDNDKDVRTNDWNRNLGDLPISGPELLETRKKHKGEISWPSLAIFGTLMTIAFIYFLG